MHTPSLVSLPITATGVHIQTETSHKWERLGGSVDDQVITIVNAAPAELNDDAAVSPKLEITQMWSRLPVARKDALLLVVAGILMLIVAFVHGTGPVLGICIAAIALARGCYKWTTSAPAFRR